MEGLEKVIQMIKTQSQNQKIRQIFKVWDKVSVYEVWRKVCDKVWGKVTDEVWRKLFK